MASDDAFHREPALRAGGGLDAQRLQRAARRQGRGGARLWRRTRQPYRARTSSIACRRRRRRRDARAAAGGAGRASSSGSPTKRRTPTAPIRERPWTLLWFRLDGPNPAALREKLFGDGAAAHHHARGRQSWRPGSTGCFRRCAGASSASTCASTSWSASSSSIVDRALSAPATPALPQALAAIVAAMRANLRRRGAPANSSRLTEPQPLADAAAVPQASAHQPAPMAACASG